MEVFFRKIKERCQSEKPTVMVIVIQSGEGTPGKTGAKMLVGEEGVLYGTVGGGSIEYQAMQTAKDLIGDGKILCEEYTLRPEGEHKLGMVCGGKTKLLFYVLRGVKDLEFAQKGLEMCEKKAPCCMVIPVTEGEAELWDMQEYHSCREKMERSGSDYYTEWFLREGKVYIFGGGHVAYELLPLLSGLDFRCVLLDDREEFANRERFPEAEEIHLVEYQNLDLPIQKEDYAVIMTRGHQYDADCERYVLGTPASYIGVMGSRKKSAYIRGLLQAEGFSEEELNRVVTPIGLSIEAETPGEIAVSIAAQLIRVRAEQRRKRENMR